MKPKTAPVIIQNNGSKSIRNSVSTINLQNKQAKTAITESGIFYGDYSRVKIYLKKTNCCRENIAQKAMERLAAH